MEQRNFTNMPRRFRVTVAPTIRTSCHELKVEV